MCGIAGFLSFDKHFSKTDLENSTNKLTHRGPDASGFYFDDIIGLGHRRLSIIDLSDSANQPMTSHCGRYIIVFNGEIYNFKELLTGLKTKLKTHSDTEVLLQSFIEWGPDFVQKLNGMFAFAIYDKEDQKLFVYRDRMGIKPLYFYQNENDFVFASELKALKQIPSLNKGEINKKAISNFLYQGYIPAPLSIYENIQKFPSGAYAVVSKNQFELKSYWKIEEQVEKKVLSNFNEAKNELRKLLLSAVEYRMVSDVPLGTFLSGGIDSSLVTAIAQKLSDKPINTFSIGFKEGKFNEADYAAKVAGHLGTNHHESILSYQDVLDHFETLFTSYDEPFSDSSAFPTMLVSEFARKHVKVILSGDGGDESYLGYGSYEWGKRLSHPISKVFKNQIRGVLKKGNSRFKRAAGLFDYQSEKRIKSHIFSQEQYLFSEKEIERILNAEYKQDVSIDENIIALNRKLSIQEQQALFDMKYYLQDDLLVKVDRASMLHSLEVRVPLIDHRLVKFALNIDENLRKQKGITKYLLKEVLYELVPKELFDRPKWGFSIPLIEWLQKDWRFLIEDLLNKNAVQEVGLFNYDIVNQYVKRFLNGEYYLYNRIWLMILLQKFLKTNSK